MTTVIALGGNALLRRGEPLTFEAQARNVRRAAAAIAAVARERRVVVTHGNGPQIGLLALQAVASGAPAPQPLDVLGAETEGMIGYLLEQRLAAELPDRQVATLLTQTIVDPDDPAFERPTKPVGPTYSPDEVEQLATSYGWTFAPDGPYMRRVVPSPEPCRIIELPAIRILVEANVLVVAAGGGGVPVVVDVVDGLRGVAAVIDKDLSAALLARALGADQLLILTDVPAVLRDWGTPAATPLARTTPRALRGLHFEAGSIGPKVDAACRFVEATGGTAAIGALEDALALAHGDIGTQIVPD